MTISSHYHKAFLKEDTNCGVMLNTQPHLEVNGVVHYVIVEELTNL